MDLIARIAQAGREAEPYLDEMKNAQSCEDFVKALRRYLLKKWMLDERTQENELYKLAILSLKAQTIVREGGDVSTLLHLNKYDCHQTNAAVQKKVLMIMQLEKALDVFLTDDLAIACETVAELGENLYMSRGCRGERSE